MNHLMKSIKCLILFCILNCHSLKSSSLRTLVSKISSASSQLFICLCFVGTQPLHSYGFENAVPEAQMYKTFNKNPASRPFTIGIKNSGLLNECTKPSPNCFTSTPAYLSDDNNDSDSLDEHLIIPKWKYVLDSDSSEAFKKVGTILTAYEPGHDNIDGGGFKIITVDPVKRYYYVQYESLRRGYLDDLEILINDDKTVQVRSASRIGYLDFGVNALRLNYLSDRLSKVGFETTKITPKTHPVYFQSNSKQ